MDTPQSRGGIVRAKKLSTKRRSEIAKLSAGARWAKERSLPTVTHGSPEHPLRIGEIEIDCYVLDNGMRVLSQRGMVKAVGFTRGGARHEEEAALIGTGTPRFATQNWIKPFIPDELEKALKSPIQFRTKSGKAYGYPATILADLCDAILSARQNGSTGPMQESIVQRCELLVRGFARLGIVALVDEATGYQEDRDRDELHRILAAYLTEERLAWAKRFPDEFYKQIYRLKGWQWPASGRAKPPILGHITNDIIYDRLPPGVLDELQRRNPTSEETKRRKWKHHQFLSPDFGQPDLRDHLLQVIAVLRISKTWESFKKNLEVAFPKPGTQIELELAEIDA